MLAKVNYKVCLQDSLTIMVFRLPMPILNQNYDTHKIFLSYMRRTETYENKISCVMSVLYRLQLTHI